MITICLPDLLDPEKMTDKGEYDMLEVGSIGLSHHWTTIYQNERAEMTSFAFNSVN